jgi:hypothetical protein
MTEQSLFFLLYYTLFDYVTVYTPHNGLVIYIYCSVTVTKKIVIYTHYVMCAF